MKVLTITGDKRFGPGNARFELQREAVDELQVVYWGKGAARIPDARRFDVVTVQDPFWRGLAALRAARKAKVRFSAQLHADLANQSFIKRMIAGYVLRRADSVRVVSNKLKTQAELLGVPDVHVLPIFVELEKFRSVHRISHEGKTVLWIGRFEHEKNPRAALSIFKEVARTIPDVRLIMLGDGRMKEELERGAVGVHVEFPGWVDPLPYLEKADAVLCTSWQESFGASIIEALAAGVPVVAPDVGIARQAGAVVVPHIELAHALKDVFAEGTKGELKLTMPTREEWKRQWRDTL
ncbi:MAG TPA: glycosyltransferase [Candidatus Paceibacterota bacterium]|nr:glycosyltransferase [Candidatus Paceibacterota bacterium]